MTNEPASSPALRVDYTTLDPHGPLGDDVLAAVAFGGETTLPPDPRCVRVALEPLAGKGLCEVWRGDGPVRLATAGPIRYVENGHCMFGWIDREEGDRGGLEEAAEAAYRSVLEFQSQTPYRCLWRLWNVMAGINEGAGDEERYKRFSLGRARAYGAVQDALRTGYPAATAVGKPRGSHTLQVCWMAGRDPGAMLENPRQVSAYRYPRRYGPAAPSFSRATVIPAQLLLISGTASIVGHASLHAGDVAAQLDETLSNLEVLLQGARERNDVAAPALGAGTLLKIYVRSAADAPLVERRLRQRLGPHVPLIMLEADICRAELLIEIEAIQHAGGATAAFPVSA
jgi:chorismate lyase/3-hydroxybenzoate synthase